jgi:hypothetical protein
VIFYHTFPLTGREVSYAPANQLFSEAWVDGFFAISGFLITSSWLNNPRPRDYFVARFLRVLPGLWFCLIITAFVVAPSAVAIQGGSVTKLLQSPAPFLYVLKNSAVAWLQPDIVGTPSGVPWPHGSPRYGPCCGSCSATSPLPCSACAGSSIADGPFLPRPRWRCLVRRYCFRLGAVALKHRPHSKVSTVRLPRWSSG